MTCDSAYFYEASNSFRAFGHVRMKQGDTLSLTSDYAYYDGNEQMAEARHHVVLQHRGSRLYCDSLNFDRMYGIGYFFEGGKLVDKKTVLTSDWGEYHTATKQAVFKYDVHLKSPKYIVKTDTLYYDTRKSTARVDGPSVVTSGKSVIHITKGLFDTQRDKAQLFAVYRNEQREEHDGRQSVSRQQKGYQSRVRPCGLYRQHSKEPTHRRLLLLQ